jgi:3-hydroxyisobutyrate dehydrogenase
MKLAFLGTGLMGGPMAMQLQHAGHEVTAWNRTVEKLVPLQAVGIQGAKTPTEAISPAEGLILMLSDAAAIAATLLTDVVTPQLSGKTVIQMGTIAPSESQVIAAEVQAAGGEYLEATVLGSIPEAKSGTLIVMVGATPTQFEQWLPVLKCFGPDPQLMGPVGAATTVKVAMNQLIGTLTAAFAMSLALVQQENVSVETFMGIVRQSALYAPTFDKKLGRMCDRNFAHPNFPTKHLLKDMNLFVQAAQGQKINAEVAQSVSQVIQKALERGLAEGDYSAVFEAISPE